MRWQAAAAAASLVTVVALGSAASADDDDGTPLAANWKAIELNGKPVDGMTLDYATDKVSGTGGCNRFNGAITIDDDAVQIGPLASTRTACEGKSELETQYFAALEAARSFDLVDGVLSLKSKDGRVILKFKK